MPNPWVISFDLDDTLICDRAATPQEPRISWFWRTLSRNEPMRLGACELFAELRKRGWKTAIYTTSYRKVGSIRRWLRAHGIVGVKLVVNQVSHIKMQSRLGLISTPSKNPLWFGIDLHVDDSTGVRAEGYALGFSVVVIEPDDLDWAKKVLDAVKAVEQSGSLLG